MRRIAYVFTESFIGCTFLLQWWQRVSYPPWVWMLLGICILAAILACLSRRLRSGSSIALCISLGLLPAFVRTAATVPITTIADALERSTVTIEGIVLEQDARPDRMQYTIHATSLRKGTGATIAISEPILVTDRNTWPRYVPDDRLRVTGKLQKPGTDSYADYLSIDGISWTLQARYIDLLQPHSHETFFHRLAASRERFSGAISRLYPEPAAALLDGILTGKRTGLSDELQETFRRTGLTHILAVSGFNITIVLSIIGGCLFFIPFGWRLAPSIIAVALFTLFVGASASVVRACIMGILGLIALHLGRPSDSRLMVLWTAFFMLTWNPRSLWYDAGFQLSFLSVMGLIELQPILSAHMEKVPEAIGIKDALLTTIAAQLTATPWVIYRFGALSLISPVANIFVAPLIPISMFVGFASVVGAFIWEPLGQIIGILGYALLMLAVLITQFWGSIPYASVALEGMGVWLVALYYLLLIGLLWAKQRGITIGTGTRIFRHRGAAS